MPPGCTPSSATVCTTLSVCGSTWLSVPSLRLLTQIAPGVATAWYDAAPTLIRAVTSPVAGSTRSSLPDWVTTHSDPNATVISHGDGSRRATVSTLPLRGSIRSSRAFLASLTHTD